MKTMNIKSTDYRVQITESGSVPGSVLAAIRKASVLCTLCSVLLISSCTHDEIIPPTPLAPQGTKTVTVDFQLPEGKPGFEVESGKMKDESTSTRATNSVLAEENLSSFNSQLSTRATTSWAEGDELLMTVDVSNNNNFAYAYLTLQYDGSAWDVVTDKSYARIILNNAATNYTYADYPLLDDITDLSLAEGLTLVLDEAFGEVTIYSVNATYAPELERNGVDDTGIALLKLKANATTTAPESWSAIASSKDASLTLQWNANQARLRVHTGVAGDVVTLTSQAFLPNDVVTPADGIYTATTQTDGYAYFYGTADSGVVDGSTSHALTSGFNLSLTAVTVGEGNAAFTCHIAPVTLLEASTLVPVQLVGGKSYRLDATEKRPDTESFAVIDGTLEADALQTAIDAAIVARKTTLYVTGEPVGEIGSAISFSGAADGSIDLILADATAIGDNNAFLYSTALKSVSAPKATTIGEYAFDACSALTSVSLPAATTIGDGAFEYCTSLKSVSAPKATTIGGYAFTLCSALTSVSLPAAETIVEYAFEGCTALKSVSLPDVTEIGRYAFPGCTSLTSVSLPEAIEIGDYAFEGCTALKSVELPAATSIGDGAFGGTSLTSVSLPAATSIGEGAFLYSTALTSVSLPAATSIGEVAFAGCTSLESVELPAATKIGNSAFFECTALKSVTFGSVIKSVGNYSFQNLHETCTLTLNSGQLSSTGDLKPIGNTWAGYTWASIRYVDDEGNAVIDGAATDADAVKAQISDALAAGQSTIYVAGTTLESAVKDAINAQANGSIDLVLLDATTIGYHAFYGYTALKSVSALAATSIGDGAFYNCTALTSVSLPAAITIGGSAFSECTALESVELPAATSIGDYAFSECTALKSVELPAATSIGKYAFSECTVLTSVSAPKATSIDYQVFKNCSALTRLTFGVVNKVMSIAIYGGTFYLAPTENCDLTLGTESTGNPEAGENKTWADKTWKSITLVGSN